MITGKQIINDKLDKILADITEINNNNEVMRQQTASEYHKIADEVLYEELKHIDVNKGLLERICAAADELGNEVEVNRQLLEDVRNAVNQMQQMIVKQSELLTRLMQMQNSSFDRMALKLNSIEYLVEGICEEMQISKASEIETRRFKNNFKWFINRNSNDNITSYVKSRYEGNSPDYDAIDERIWNILPESGTFLDIGANIGAFSLPLASFGWKGYAFEASVKNADLLQKSIAANRFDIQLINKAVWNKTGKIHFVQNGPQGFVKDSIHPGEDYEVIDAVCLDDYKMIDGITEIRNIDFIKMDIEGSEINALRGMRHFLEEVNYPPMFIEVNIWNLFCMGETPKSLFEEAAVLGYKPYMIYKESLLEYDINSFPTNPCTDYLFIKNVTEYWKGKIRGKAVCDSRNDVEFVCREMVNFKNWCLDYGTNPEEVRAHIAWYALIMDYPECAGDERIQGLQGVIRGEVQKYHNMVFDKMLDGTGNC